MQPSVMLSGVLSYMDVLDLLRANLFPAMLPLAVSVYLAVLAADGRDKRCGGGYRLTYMPLGIYSLSTSETQRHCPVHGPDVQHLTRKV